LAIVRASSAPWTNHTGKAEKSCHPDATLAGNRMRKLQIPPSGKPLIFNTFFNMDFSKKQNF
jgi:hypothetical protein